MALSDEELERYARHIVLREVGGAGQAKLAVARVLVVGAGGLGSPVILYLAAAGVGTIQQLVSVNPRVPVKDRLTSYKYMHLFLALTFSILCVDQQNL